MSSSEDYLDSLLDSILGGGKHEKDEKPAPGGAEVAATEDKPAADAGKAMSPDEIEEMLVSMGTLDGGEEQPQASEGGDQSQASEDGDQPQGSNAEDMEAMLAFMNQHNASVAEAKQTEDSFSPDDLDFGEDELSYASVDDLTPEESETDEIASDALTDINLDELSLDDLDLGEEELPDEGVDAFSLDQLASGEESVPDESSDFDRDDFSLDDLSLDDLDLGENSVPQEPGTDDGAQDDMSDFSLDDLSLDDLDLGEDSMPEETGAEESAQDEQPDFEQDSLSLDDLMSEEGAPDDADGLMSEEEIDRLLGGDMSFEEESDASDDLALEENGEGDDDLTALLAGMDHDEDLSEIHNLLGESEQGVSADDDMLAMLEGSGGDEGASFDLFENDEAAREAESIRELTPEEIAAREGGGEQGKKKGKKKRKKLFGKKKGDNEEQPAEEMEIDLEDLLGEGSAQEPDQEVPKEKKPGFITRIMDFLLEGEEDDEDPLAAEVLAGNGGATGYISGENRELLDELSEEDKKGKKKKKDKKQKKGKEDKEEKKPKKEKKKKKKKKEKAANPEVDLFAPPERKLSKKKVVIVFLFCGTLGACIILATSLVPNYMQEQSARIAYDQKEYGEVYDLLYGKELNEEDETIFQRSRLILRMSRKLSSYENYVNLDMPLEALDALVSGVECYQVVLPEAETYNVVGEVSDIYVQILGRLSADFGVSEADALDIISSEDDVTYSQKLMDIINGIYSGGADDMSGGRQDVLPEEEEIIERIDGLEEDAPDELPEEEVQDGQSGDDVQDVQPEEEPTADENSDEGSEV